MPRKPKKDLKTLASDIRSAADGVEIAATSLKKADAIYKEAKARLEGLLLDLEYVPKPRVRKKTDATSQGKQEAGASAAVLRVQ